MTDLNAVLPAFPTDKFGAVLPSLERSYISTTDLITLDANEIAKRAQLPVQRVRDISAAVLAALHDDLGVGTVNQTEDTEASKGKAGLRQDGRSLVKNWQSISTLDEAIDAALEGGIPTGYITEITGESGVGKTQLLLTLLLSAQLPPPRGLSRKTLYISTEAPLSTSRLAQLLRSNPVLKEAEHKPTLDNVVSIVTPDLESQDHILRFQLPIAVRRHNVGLVVLDSVAANYRAEFERSGAGWNGSNMAKRSEELVKLGQMLRDLARTENLAVVVANQVADRFTNPGPIRRPVPVQTRYQSSPLAHKTTVVLPSSSAPEPTSSLPAGASDPSAPSAPAASSMPAAIPHVTDTSEIMTLDHQQRWFTGWGNDRSIANLKTPSLGLIWTNQIACRIALIKSPIRTHYVENTGSAIPSKTWRRWVNVVFAPWAGPSIADGGDEDEDEEEGDAGDGGKQGATEKKPIEKKSDTMKAKGMLEYEITSAGLQAVGTQYGGKFKRKKTE